MESQELIRWFSSLNGRLIRQELTIEWDFPLQFKDEWSKVVLEDVASTGTQGAAAGLAFLFVLQLITATSLKLIWGLLLSLQVMVSIRLLDFPIPANLDMFLEATNDLLTLKFIPT